MGKQTLEQRVNAGIMRHQFWFDDWRAGSDVYLHCAWCGGQLLVDYFQFSKVAMSRRIATFAAKHKACPPPEDV